MRTWTVDAGVVFLGRPDPDQIAHYRDAELRRALEAVPDIEDEDVDLFDGLFGGDSGDDEYGDDEYGDSDDDDDEPALFDALAALGVAGQGLAAFLDEALVSDHTQWWFERADCEEGDCDCGPVTLLEAIGRLSGDERRHAVIEHMAVMRELYDHFWSGQGIISGSSQRVLDACVGCLVDGPPHVWDVFEAARTFAEDLGEAIAAHDCVLDLGKAREFTSADDATDS